MTYPIQPGPSFPANISRSGHLALNSPLGHLNGDSTNSYHQIPDTKLHGDSKAQFLTCPTTYAGISIFSTSHNWNSSQYSQA